MDKNVSMSSKHFVQMTEQIRLSYAHLLKMYMQLCQRYKLLKKGHSGVEEMKKIFHQVDRYFYDETGKINWNIIHPLMPPNIEKNIKKEYGALNEKEIKLCCLLLFDVSVNNIADILLYTHRSVHSITYRIKQKTGMIDIKANLKNLLLNERIE